MPPAHYEEAVEKSQIKAIAEVQFVKVMGHYKAVDEKMINFRLVKSFGETTPFQLFTGRCRSINKRWNEKYPPPGGNIYYYPQRGDKVYVTVSENGGYITSYTRLTPSLEKALDTDFKSVKTKMGMAYVDQNAE